MNLAEKILAFNEALELSTKLPQNIAVLNPFKGEERNLVKQISKDFYTKFYSDQQKRFAIFGINPGRLGAGLTGIPFTDTEGLEKYCGISAHGIVTRETSAAFVYEMISAFTDVQTFYKQFFIGAVSPLGYVKKNNKGRFVNYNYYDEVKVANLLMPTIEKWFELQFELGMRHEIAYCFGTGKNYKYLKQLNQKYSYYQKLIPLEHPRFIMQYRNKQKTAYIQKYITAFEEAITL